jgi:hypothetical protein
MRAEKPAEVHLARRTDQLSVAKSVIFPSVITEDNKMNLAGKRTGAPHLAASLILMGIVLTGGASAATLDRIGQDRTIRIACRDDAPPFSYKDKIGEPVGFMVELCRKVARELADQLQLKSLNVTYVPVTATDRFDVIQQQKATSCASRQALPYRGASWSIFRFRHSSTAPA